jgi:hypothetical protein
VFRALFPRRSQPAASRSGFRPCLEALEERTLLHAASALPVHHPVVHLSPAISRLIHQDEVRFSKTLAAKAHHHHSTNPKPQGLHLLRKYKLANGKTLALFRTPRGKFLAKVIRGPRGPRGFPGPQGPVGPQGPQGPSGTVISYSLAAGASSAPITVAADRPVFIVANNTTAGDRGTGSLSVEHPAGDFLEWSGVNSTSNASPTPTLTGGFGPGEGGVAAGTTMLNFDYFGEVTLQLADADHFVIHNADVNTQTGTIWILTAPPG